MQPHGLQHPRLPCPPSTPGAYSNSCALSQWYHPTILFFVIPSPPPLNLSQHQGLLKWVSSSHQVAKVLELQLQHQCFQWNSGLISFRVDWYEVLACQGILKSLLQHRSSKASNLQHTAFFMVHVSHPYMTTGKTIILTRHTCVGKVMSLLFNMLSRFSSKE